jgi:hypothetical protein
MALKGQSRAAWEFRVMSAAQLAEHGYRSVTLGFLDRLPARRAVQDANEAT